MNKWNKQKDLNSNDLVIQSVWHSVRYSVNNSVIQSVWNSVNSSVKRILG